MFSFKFNNYEYKHIHFIGIGGISMSGLAEILLTKEYKITGTDNKKTDIIKRLENLGASIYIGHNKDNINGADLIVYTDAISDDNEELIAARKSNIPTVDRATFLGAIMLNYKNSIAVSGTHGKTTTTSMIASITNHGTINPTVLLGGQLDEIGGNVRLGSKDCILTEACEYKANILKYYPTMAIILNIDEDHLDYFKNMDHIVDTFVGYGKNLKEDSYLVINQDDPYSSQVIENTLANVVTFGIDSPADYQATDIKYLDNSSTSFTLTINNEESWPINIKTIGKHNVYNALASIIAAHLHGLGMEEIIKNISLYKGVQRRLELKGYLDDVKILDDYAHHPTEIQTTLEALSQESDSNLYCIFQPHTFTRTKSLLDSFSKAFIHAKEIIITDIYAARELDNGEIHSKDLVKAINKESDNAKYISTFSEVESYLLKQIKPGDTILTMGAGDVYLIGESLLEEENDDGKKRTAV